MRLLFLASILAFSTSIFAQQTGVLSGAVIDGVTGEALPLANLVFGGGEGCSTDFDGNYTIILPFGSHTFEVSYVGYKILTGTLEINAAEVSRDFKLEVVMLDQAEVFGDVAIERETPVAFTNVLPAQIKEELGSQQVPMILNSTPGVYASPSGSGDGNARVSIRGFKQRNVAVMFDGIPVNEMENGNVFWSNWFGADLIMRSTQVQRGLGASKLTLPAIGGTINITTKNIDSKRSFRAKQELGGWYTGRDAAGNRDPEASFDTFRSSIGFNSGRLENGWGVTLAASYMDRTSFQEETSTQAAFYFVKMEKQLKRHLLSFTAFGAPTNQNNSGYRNAIVTYDKNLAAAQFEGSADDYARMTRFSQAYLNQANNPGNAEALAEYQAVAQETGFVDSEGNVDKGAFDKERSATQFIDTTNVVSGGLRYNNHWGILKPLNGASAVLNERQRQYHKPLISLKHTFAVNDRLSFNSIAYYSQGVGGGSTRDPGLGAGDYTPDLQVDFQESYNNHVIGGPFGPPIDGTYSDTELKSSVALLKTFNNHYWAGILSSANYQINEQWRLNAGVDLRTYEGNSFREVFDLLGGDYYIGEPFDWNQNELDDPQDRVKREGDVVGFNSDALIRWAGIFGLLEYKKGPWSAFFNATGVNNWYKRIDYFLHRNEDGTPNSSDWETIPGFTLKTGANYNINDKHSVFMNTGFLSRTPRFRNVIDFRNERFLDVANEKISALEFGYSWLGKNAGINVNTYYTIWENRPFDGGVSVEINDEIVRANINAMDARHMGIEIAGSYEVGKKVDLDVAMSFGDWIWTSQDSVNFFDQNRNLLIDNSDPNNPVPFYRSFDAEGVLVGDAPQVQVTAAVRYAPVKDAYIKPRFTFFDKYYADFDPLGLSEEKAGRQSWKIPAYSLLDIHGGYTFRFDNFNIGINASIFNALDAVYFADAQNNEGTAIVTLGNGFSPERTVAFDANSAGVIIGFGRRYNVGVELSF